MKGGQVLYKRFRQVISRAIFWYFENVHGCLQEVVAQGGSTTFITKNNMYNTLMNRDLQL